MVDLRQSSKTFGQWFGVTLSEKKQADIYPSGFAHGFLTIFLMWQMFFIKQQLTMRQILKDHFYGTTLR